MRPSNSTSEGPASKRRKTDKSQAEDDDIDSVEGVDEGPACHSCRKRKAKCSRQQPCQQCVRLNIDCVYDDKKTRPGMRTGAIETLNRRLSALEQMFLGQGLLLKPLLDRALQESGVTPATPNGVPGDALPLSDQVETLKRSYIERTEATSSWQDRRVSPVRECAKSGKPQTELSDFQEFNNASLADPYLPPENVVDALVEWYFEHVHPWIPILHVRLFREDIRTSRRHELKIVLYAIVSLCLRFDQTSTLSEAQKKHMSLRCRHAVILQSMEKFSVASLQALVIIAFDIIGSGRGPSAWSVVGSMTRTVEQLRLSVEDGDAGAGKDAREFLIRRMSFLRESNSWIESEERRRVFWNVFLMDRFCSVATGWNNSLTSADVRRRLPCEGAIWQAGNPVRTPYFGIAERSSPSQHVLTPTSERHPADEEEVESIGGFAFCIEATESLNLVTAFFLQHAIDFIDPQGIQMWLMRFKELDLRLVKWRLFLPPKWRNASVLNQDGIMDPNLTLAHITHNTAVIQLHQCVAYPSPQWRACPVSLPSANSAETCITAACEVSTIAQQFLHLSPGITSPQFSFCLFIAGRVLLAHSAYNGTGLHPAFDPVTSSLTEIARRWTGRRDPSSTGNELPVSSAPYQYTESPEEQDENLASKFSKRLEHARRRVGSERNNSQDPTLDIHQPVYSDQMDQCRTGSTMPRDAVSSPIQRQQDIDGATVALDGMDHSETGYSPDSISLAFPPLPVSFERFPEHAEAIGSLGSQSRVHFEDGDLHHGAQNVSSQQSHPMLNVNLDDMFGDQYHQLLRVSTFADAHQTYANYISSDGQGL